MTTKSDTTKKNPRTLQGVVVSDKNDKTVVVLVDRFVQHPMYKKFYKVSKKYHAHDPKNTYKEGDKVTIQEAPKVSKKKSFIVVEQN